MLAELEGVPTGQPATPSRSGNGSSAPGTEQALVAEHSPAEGVRAVRSGRARPDGEAELLHGAQRKACNASRSAANVHVPLPCGTTPTRPFDASTQRGSSPRDGRGRRILLPGSRHRRPGARILQQMEFTASASDGLRTAPPTGQLESLGTRKPTVVPMPSPAHDRGARPANWSGRRWDGRRRRHRVHPTSRSPSSSCSSGRPRLRRTRTPTSGAGRLLSRHRAPANCSVMVRVDSTPAARPRPPARSAN